MKMLDIIALLAIICGILVITNKNPIVSVLFLIGLFLSISGYLMLIGINFIAFSYLLVYVGAVSILFLFILMLINIRISELSTNNSNSISLALFIGMCFSYFVEKIFSYNIKIPFYKNYNNLVYVTSNTWDDIIAESSDISAIGNILYTNYFIWLILTSIILLLAMVGAIIITLGAKK